MTSKRLLLAICLIVGLGPLAQASAQRCPPGQSCPPRYQPPTIQAARASVPAAVKRSQKAVVRVWNVGRGSIDNGSGVYIGSGLVLTCNHIFSDGVGKVTVGFGAMIGTRSHRASVLACDRTWDLALLRVSNPPKNAATAPLANVVPRVGDVAVSVGYGQRCILRPNTGRVKGFGKAKNNGDAATDTMILTGSARSGDSGGPIFNSRGEISGILWGTDDRTVCGTQVGRVLLCFRSFFGRRPQQPRRPRQPPLARVPADIVAPNTALLAEVAALRKEVAWLKNRLRAFKPNPGLLGPVGPKGSTGNRGPQGLTGMPGAPGKDGSTATMSEKDLDALAALIHAKLNGSMTIKVTPIKSAE